MDAVKEFSSQILEIISKNHDKNAAKCDIKKVIESIDAAHGIEVVNIPSGLTWFGVSRSLTRQDLSDKLVVLDMFTYCCMNCIHILPHLKALEEKYVDKNILVVIGVHSPKFPNEKSDENVLNAITKLNITHPVVNDPEHTLWDELGVICWPTLVVLGPTGRPIFTAMGEGHHEELELFLEAAAEHYATVLKPSFIPTSQAHGPVTSSALSYPGAVAVSADGTIALADTGHHRVLLLTSSGLVKEVIGGPMAGYSDGSFTHARFRDPQSVIFHGQDELFVADTGNHAVRSVNLVTGAVSTIVGVGTQGQDTEGGLPGLEQPISSPWGLCLVPARAPSSSNSSTTPDTSAPPPPPAFRGPPPPPPPPGSTGDLAAAPFSSLPAASPVTVPTPSGVATPPRPPDLKDFPPPPVFSAISSPPILKTVPPPPASFSDAPLPPAPPRSRILTAVPPPPPSFCDIPPPRAFNDEAETGEALLISMSGSHQIWAYFLQDTVWWKSRVYKAGVCSAVVGSGTEENRNSRYPRAAGLAQPSGIAYSPTLEAVFVADSESSTIRRICLKTGEVAGVVGGDIAPDNLFSYGDVDGKGKEVKLQHPLDISWTSNSTLIIADTYNSKLKTLNAETRTCSNVDLAGGKLHQPSGVCVHQGDIFIADTDAHRLVCIRDGVIFQEIPVQFPSATAKSKRLRKTFQTEVGVSSEGSNVKLVVAVGDGFEGRWRIIQDSFPGVLKSPDAGELTSGEVPLEFVAGSASRLTLELDVTHCGDDACRMEYLQVDVTIKVDEGAEKKILHHCAAKP